MRLMGLTAIMVIALVGSAGPTLAQADRATEQAAKQAQYLVRNVDQAVDQALYQARNARQDANRTAVQTEGERSKEKEERTNEVTQETTAVTIPESGGIPIGNLVLLSLGGALLIGTRLIACEATQMRRYYCGFPRIIRKNHLTRYDHSLQADRNFGAER